jgi:glycosyltransferase involved in cell wall biosynthesis
MVSKPLSVVVPVHNIAGHVDHLADELAGIADLDPQVIVVDDGSDDGTGAALRQVAGDIKDFTLVETAENAGAGAARNAGFPLATGTYTLFFDGDDYLHLDAIRATLDRLERSGADVSLNRYDFIRDGHSTSTGMNVIDRVLWREFSGRFAGGTFALAEAPRFLEFTNYPWNKLVRTAHYQALGLDPLFGKTRVNNDILGHWNILLGARTMVLVDEVIVTHHISGARDHLSNRFGPERLDLVVALTSVHDILRGDPERFARHAPVFWSFVRRLVTWAEGKLKPGVVAAFDRQVRALAGEVSFEELLATKTSDASGTYRWLMDRIDPEAP